MESPASNPPTYPDEMQLVLPQMLLSLRMKKQEGSWHLRWVATLYTEEPT